MGPLPVAIHRICPIFSPMNDWQTLAAVAAVILAALYVAAKAAGKKGKKPSCGHGCGCGKK